MTESAPTWSGSGTVLAINGDPAPMFECADIGIVGDWREIIPLAEELGTAMPRDTGTTGPARTHACLKADAKKGGR